VTPWGENALYFLTSHTGQKQAPDSRAHTKGQCETKTISDIPNHSHRLVILLQYMMSV